MRNIKKRLAVFLCLLMAAPVVLGCLPVNSLKAEAATNVNLNWIISGTWVPGENGEPGMYKCVLQTEVGQQFYLGDMVRAYSNSWSGARYLSTITGETYKSSKKSVATVSTTGIVKVLKPGTTTFSVTYKGVTTNCEMKAVKAGGLGSGSSTCKALKSKAKSVISACGTKVSAANRYKVSQTLSNYLVASNKVNSVNYNGFKCEKLKTDWGSYYSTTNKLVVPEMLHVSAIMSKYSDYVKNCNPIGTNQSSFFKISSASGKGGSRTVTINLKSAVTRSQIFGIKAGTSDSYIREDGRGVFTIRLVDKTTGHKYYGLATTKLGSKKITLNMNYLTLKKGRIYRLEGVETWNNVPYGWTNGKAFRAK